MKMSRNNANFHASACQQYMLILLSIVINLQSATSLALTQASTSNAPTRLWTTNEPSPYPTGYNGFTSSTQSGRTMPLPTGGFSARPAGSFSQQQTQPKSLKFTLISGKYWRFNIKTNSLQASQAEKELRLHRNVSTGNYIIDDDGWFQYNHQQQQLFAWPSLGVKPSTYYFVLLPSALDYEADGENVINAGDVVANIVVELIRPNVAGVLNRLDLDQLIDYKLSLDFLHRHSSYPLLLTQIVSIFDLLSRGTTSTSSGNGDLNTSYSPSTIAATHQATSKSSSVTNSLPSTSFTTTTSSGLVASQSKQTRLAGKFIEFLLIDSTATPEGDFFSLTWTTHPTLINNTIVPISECRLSMINDTLSKLSSRSILYPVVDDKFVISYALEGPLVNSQAIIPTERGNYALKLTLLNACKTKRSIDELGVTSAKGFPLDIDDKDSIAPPENPTSLNLSTETPSASVDGDLAQPEPPERQDSKQDRVHNSEHASGATDLPAETFFDAHRASTSHIQSTTPLIEPGDPNLESTSGTTVTTRSGQTTEAYGSDSASSTVQLQTERHLAPISQQTPDPLLQIQTSIRRALGTSALPATTNNQGLSQPKLQTRKFTENSPDSFFDMKMNSNITTVDSLVEVSTVNPKSPDLPNTSILPDTLNGTITTVTVGKNGQESSLNDDLIGILNEITEFMVSIAVPLAIVLGIILIVCILIAICNLCIKKRKSKQFEVSDRFKFRYGSERKTFLKKSSKPVILEADQKSLSMGGTPRHQPLLRADGKSETTDKKKKSSHDRHAGITSGSDFFAMSLLSKGNQNTDGNREAGGCSREQS